MRGIKQTGVGWPRCCPPDGNKAAIVDALVTRAGGGGSVDISDPGTAERSRTRSRLTPAAADGALPFTADTPLAKLRTFIDAQNLNVSKSVGGRARRTKLDMLADIHREWQQKSLHMMVGLIDDGEEEEGEGSRKGLRVSVTTEGSPPNRV